MSDIFKTPYEKNEKTQQPEKVQEKNSNQDKSSLDKKRKSSTVLPDDKPAKKLKTSGSSSRINKEPEQGRRRKSEDKQ